jgi:hypothetical protein
MENRNLKIALSVLAVLAMAYFATSRSFYDDVLANAFFAIELGSLSILLFRLSPKWSNAAYVAGLLLAFGFIDFELRHFEHFVMAWFSFLGLASFAVLVIRVIWDNDRELLKYACATAFIFTASEYCASSFLLLTTRLHPKALDLYLMLFDGSLGRVQPVFLFGRLYVIHPWLHTVSLAAYIGLAVPITMVYTGRLVRFGKKALAALAGFVIAGPLGVTLYNIFPAIGPRALLGNDFPFHPIPHALLPQVVLGSVALPGWRNAMPSLHLAWTLLAWWYSRGLSKTERAIAFAFLALTAFATMGTGEHWLADLVVAFPFALMVQAICAFELPIKDARRQAAFFFGLFATFTWLALLRYGTRLFWTSPIVPWSLIAGTLALTTLRQQILESAQASWASHSADVRALHQGASESSMPLLRSKREAPNEALSLGPLA